MAKTKKKTNTTWDADLLFGKSQRYVEKMLEHDKNSWEFGLWSSLSLELLCRATLAHISPVLLAESKDWHNTLYALNGEIVASKFTPKSITTGEVIERLAKLLPSFDSDLKDFCITHTGLRNAELHSGETPFDGKNAISWLAEYYRACTILLKHMKYDLKDYLGDDEAIGAKKIIAAAKDKTTQATRKLVESYQSVWSKKDKSEKDTRSKQASVWAMRSVGHKVKCPACGSDSIVIGDSIGAPKREISRDDVVTEKQQHLPSKFQCVACDLKISGLSSLISCGVGDTYTKTTTFNLADLYTPEDEYPEYDDDNNEPF